MVLPYVKKEERIMWDVQDMAAEKGSRHHIGGDWHPGANS